MRDSAFPPSPRSSSPSWITSDLPVMSISPSRVARWSVKVELTLPSLSASMFPRHPTCLSLAVGAPWFFYKKYIITWIKIHYTYIISTYIIGIVMSASCLAVVSKISILMDMEAMFPWGQTRQIQFECCITWGWVLTDSDSSTDGASAFSAKCAHCTSWATFLYKKIILWQTRKTTKIFAISCYV